MNQMCVVRIRSLVMPCLLIFGSLAFQVGFAGPGDDATSGSNFDCDRHSPEEVMPGLARFRGDSTAGGVERAIAQYKQAASKGEVPQSEAKYCIGKLLFDAGELERAEAYFSEAIELDPGAHEAYFGRGVVRSDLDRCNQAISDFQVVAELSGAQFGLSTEAAIAYYECDRPKEALHEIESAMQMLPGDQLTVDLLIIRAKVLLDLSRYAEAAESSSRAVARMREISSCAAGLGLCRSPSLISAVDVHLEVLCALGNADHARKVYEKYEHYSHPAPQFPSCVAN